jgi:ElaB/YqjD/DUF883 family membrane-anchored ribosome-binding protein
MAERKTAEAVGAAVDEKVGEARERLSEVARGAGERYQKVAEEMRREAERATQAAREKVDAAVSGVKQQYAKVSKRVGSVSEDVADYVRDNPGKSLLIAAGVGFLVGLLFRRSSDD